MKTNRVDSIREPSGGGGAIQSAASASPDRPPAWPFLQDHPVFARLELFRVVAFDWDGTAVWARGRTDRVLVDAVRRLLAEGKYVAVITSTDVREVDSGLGRHLPPGALGDFCICSDRGSRFYGYAPNGTLGCLRERRATSGEKALLDGAVESFRCLLRERYGLRPEPPTRRFNRRKIDVLAALGTGDVRLSPAELDRRLGSYGVAGGLRELVRLLGDVLGALAQELRVTTDGRCVEVGITDKADAARWLFRRMQSARLGAEDFLYIGDEFAPVGGIRGSDARVRIPELSAGTFLSVANSGPPEEGVSWVGGGPESTRAILSGCAGSRLSSCLET